MKTLFALLCAALLCFPALSQDYSSDTESIANILTAALECISVEQDEPVNWDRWENLFLPDATLSSAYKANLDPNNPTETGSIRADSLRFVATYSDRGFREVEISRKVERFGDIAMVFQSYEAEHGSPGLANRGINCYQLVFSNGRWWIVSLLWQREHKGLVLPEEYRKKP